MAYSFKVLYNNDFIPFDVAIERNYVVLTSYGFYANEGVEVLEYTGLLDGHNNKIFDKDILRSENGERYIIKKTLGTFYFSDINKNKGCLPIALNGLKFGNKIDGLYIEL